MKEIFHEDNKRLDAIKKIREEVREIIDEDGYLEYADTSVSPSAFIVGMSLKHIGLYG